MKIISDLYNFFRYGIVINLIVLIWVQQIWLFQTFLTQFIILVIFNIKYMDAINRFREDVKKQHHEDQKSSKPAPKKSKFQQRLEEAMKVAEEARNEKNKDNE